MAWLHEGADRNAHRQPKLVEAGEAQQERATEQLRALRHEVKAEAKEAKAEALEMKQRNAQRAKEAV